MVATLLGLSPDGSPPVLQGHWSARHVPLGMVYPSSLVVHTGRGYKRARDFRTDSKYTQDASDHIPVPGTQGMGLKDTRWASEVKLAG